MYKISGTRTNTFTQRQYVSAVKDNIVIFKINDKIVQDEARLKDIIVKKNFTTYDVDSLEFKKILNDKSNY